MNNQPSSPILTEPNSPTMTIIAPSDSFLQIRATQIKRMVDQIFDDSILPDYWSTKMKKLTRSVMEDMITHQDTLLKKLEETKQLLQTSPSPPDQLFGLIQNLTQAVNAYKRAMISATNCKRYLPKES